MGEDMKGQLFLTEISWWTLARSRRIQGDLAGGRNWLPHNIETSYLRWSEHQMLIMYNLICKNKHSCHCLHRLCRLKKTRSSQPILFVLYLKRFLPATYSPWDEWERISPQSWETEGTKTQQEKSLPGPGCCCCQLRPGPSHKHPVIDLPWAAAPSTIARKLWATFVWTHIDSKYTPIS